MFLVVLQWNATHIIYDSFLVIVNLYGGRMLDLSRKAINVSFTIHNKLSRVHSSLQFTHTTTKIRQNLYCSAGQTMPAEC